MDIAFILIFFMAITIFGLIGRWKDRNKWENVLYISAIIVSAAVLLLKGLDLLPWSPVTALTEVFDNLGLLHKP